MALKLWLLLSSAVVPIGKWVIVIPGEEPRPEEIKRWVYVLNKAEFIAGSYLKVPAPRNPVIRVAPSSGDFAAWTGCSIWQGAALKEGELIVQPLAVLEKRGVFEEVIIHEYLHLFLGPYKVPRWFNEGLAVICSNQVQKLGGAEDLPRDVGKIEKLLSSSDTLDLRLGYLAAAALTSEKINQVGRDSLALLIKEEAL